MKRLAIVALLVALPATAAPSNSEILRVIAMPLATAAVTDVRGIPPDEIKSLAGTLNEAVIAPEQFVVIMQYAPIALTTHAPAEPSFVEFIQAQLAQGVAGPALVAIIERKLPAYGVSVPLPALAVPEPHAAANDETFFPQAVRAHFAQPAAPPEPQTTASAPIATREKGDQ